MKKIEHAYLDQSRWDEEHGRRFFSQSVLVVYTKGVNLGADG